MKFKKLSVILLTSLGLVTVVQANEVGLGVDQKTTITYRVAHKKGDQQPVFEEAQTIDVKDHVTIPVSLDGYDKAGIVIVAANGHELPPSANQFDQPKQCSMTTDQTKTSGEIKLALSDHAVSCATYGGVFQ